MKEKPNLDLLRSLAVSIVVAQHTLLTLHLRRIGTWDITKLGGVGVFTFFLHTSLVLIWSLERRPNVLDFYTRRAFRIYPIAIIAVLATVLFHIPTMHNLDGDAFYYAPSAGNLIANLLLVQNFVWPGNILLVMWSLPLEVDMYLVLPFIYTIAVGKSALSRLLFIWGLVIALNWVTSPADYFSFTMCIPDFLAGAVASVVFARVRPRLPGLLLPVWLGVLLACYMVQPTTRSGWWLTIALAMTLPLFRSIQSKWLVKASHQIAKYSYGVYLFHLFCIVFGLVFLRDYNHVLQAAGLIGMLVVLSVAGYHLVEKPMINLGARIGERFFEPEQALAAAD